MNKFKRRQKTSGEIGLEFKSANPKFWHYDLVCQPLFSVSVKQGRRTTVDNSLWFRYINITPIRMCSHYGDPRKSHPLVLATRIWDDWAGNPLIRLSYHERNGTSLAWLGRIVRHRCWHAAAMIGILEKATRQGTGRVACRTCRKCPTSLPAREGGLRFYSRSELNPAGLPVAAEQDSRGLLAA